MSKELKVSQSRLDQAQHIISTLGDVRQDADNTMILARELEHVSSRAFEVKTTPVSGLQRFPESQDAIAPGKETVVYRVYDGAGMAKIIASGGTDLPGVDVSAKEYTAHIKPLGNMYSFTRQELKAAAFGRESLPSRKAVQAIKGHEVKMNQIFWYGDAEYNLSGFFANPNIGQVIFPANGTASSSKLSAKTPEQIVDDFNSLINPINDDSNGIFQANEVWMPINVYSYIKTKKNSASSDITILQFLESVHNAVTFIPVPELKDVNGVARMYALENSSANFERIVPEFPQELPVQVKGMDYIIPVESSCGGVIVHQPMAIRFADDVW